MNDEQKAAFIMAQAACLIGRVLGMHAENMQRQHLGLSMAYQEDSYPAGDRAKRLRAQRRADDVSNVNVHRRWGSGYFRTMRRLPVAWAEETKGTFMADMPTPRTDALIEDVMRRFPGASISSDARYYEAVHQELAPLARTLEREAEQTRRDAADDAARLIADKMKFFQRVVELERQLSAAQARCVEVERDARQERDKLLCEAIIATQNATLSGRLVCDVEKLLHYFNTHRPDASLANGTKDER